MREATDTRRRRSPVLLRAAVAAAVLFAGGAAVAWVLLSGGWPESWSVGAFESLIRSWGAWGVAASVGLMIVHSFVPFPAELVAVANGMVYGPYWGTVITWTGAMAGAFLAFGLSRAFGRPFVRRMVRRREWGRMDDWLARQSGDIVFLGRFLPVISFNLINYAAGLMRMSWWTFALATGLGILPMTILMVVLGDRIETLGWTGWLAIMAAGLALWLAVRGLVKMRRGKPGTGS